MKADRPVPSQFGGSTVLVTGGLGFIGSTLVRRLIGSAKSICVIDNLWPDYGGNLFNISGIEDQVRVNISDIRDQYSLAHLVQGVDFIFNLAGQTSHMDSMTDPSTDLDINCRAQLSILEAIRSHNPTTRVVFASTRQVYGAPKYLPVDENHPLHPVDVNGINKLAGENYHTLYHDVYGIRTTILRLTNTYGPRMRVKDARQTFLGTWIRLAVEGQPFEVWGGDQLRDFTYVDDAVEALLVTAVSDECVGRTFNVGGLETVSLQRVAEIVSEKAAGSPFVFREFPADRKKIDIGDYYCTDQLLREQSGWQPTVPLDEGLTLTVDYYRRHLSYYL